MSLDESDNKDLSPSAVKRAVLNSIFQRPIILYSAVAACLGGAYAFAIEASFLALIAAGAGSAIGVLSWIWEYVVKGDTHAIRYVKKYRQSLESKREDLLRKLEKELQNLGRTDALKQLELFREKYASFVDILDKKFDQTELTYMRYLAVAEQVFLGGIDNLEKVSLALDSVSAIDLKHIQKRIEELQTEDDDISAAKIHELQQRKNLKQEQEALTRKILLDNEKALTQLDIVATRIAAINTENKQARVALDVAMEELQRMAQRTSEYNSSAHKE